MENKKYVIGIDIGSSNVVMAVGHRNENGEITVLGVDVQEVEDSVKDGDIINYIELGKAIAKAKSALESELGLRLNSAYVGVSGRSVYCVRYEDYVEINTKTGCVTDAEMRELNARIDMVVPAGGDKIIQRIPLRYSIDNHQDVQNPLGAFGSKLSATYLLVMMGAHLEDRVNRALHRAEIRANGLCVSPTLLPELLLTPYEKEEGVVIVDIGSDLTDISVVRENKLWYFSSLPIGASSINNDLHDFLKISKKEINPLKHKYGSAIASCVPDNTSISVKTAGHAKKQILQRNIAEIAEERLKDIAQFVMRELRVAKFSTKVPCGVVLTGGSAYLDNIDKLFARELNMEVRLGDMLNGLDDDSQQSVSAYPQSVVMGLLLYGAKHNACEAIPGPIDYTVVNDIPHETGFSTGGTVNNAPTTFDLPTDAPAEVEPTNTDLAANNTVVAPQEENTTVESHVAEPELDKSEDEEPKKSTDKDDESNGSDTKDRNDDDDEVVDDDDENDGKGWWNKLKTWIDDRFEQKNEYI